MAETIDSISIELTASTQSAENSIQRVIDALRMLQSAAIDASAESRIGKSIRSIAKAAKEVDTDAGQKLARLAGGLKALSKVGDLSNLADAGKNLSGVVRAVNSIGQSGGKGLSNLANGIKQTSDALGSIKDADVSKLGAVRDALSGEMSGSLHTSARVNESTALGGMGTPEPSFGNMAAYGAMTVFKYTADSIRDATMAYREFGAALAEGGSSVDTQFTDSMMTVFKYTADSIRDATAAYREFRAALGSGVPPIFTEFAEDVRDAASAVRQLKGETNGWTWGNGSAGFDWASAWAARQPKALNAGQDFTFGSSGLDKSSAIEVELRDLGESADYAAERFANFRMSPLADDANEAGAAFGNLTKVLSGLSDVLGHVANGLIAIPKSFGSFLIGRIEGAIKAFKGLYSSIVRIAKYRMIRTMLKMITQGVSEGIKSLYNWSRTANTTFYNSMNTIATATKYLGNSFAAMVSPLINALAPAIDFVIDKVVAVLNAFNQLFAALSGASTYTVAKKVATTWGDATDGISSGADGARDSINELKRTILGFDEINKLDKFNTPSSGGGSGGGGKGSSSGGEIVFEEKPLEGFLKDLSEMTSGWPDWLKWLFGIGAVAIGAWGISLLPKLIGTIWDAVKKLFSTVIPDWFKWLFGPKGDGNIDIDIPDHIDIPDGKVKVDIEKGDWSALDEIPSEKKLTLKVGVKMDGWIGDQVQQAAIKSNGLAAINNQLEKMVDNWDDLAWEVAQMPSGTIIDRTLSVAVERSENWDATAWNVANWEDGKVINISAAVALVKSWKGTALAALGLNNLSTNVNVKLVKSGWTTLAKYVGTYTVSIGIALGTKASDLWRKFKKEWNDAKTTLYAEPDLDHTGEIRFKRFKKEWNDARTTLYAEPDLDHTGEIRFKRFKKEWNDARTTLYAEPALDNTGGALWGVFKKEWDDSNPIVTAYVVLEKSDWTDVSTYLDDNFGGATGGGGKTSGGGAGRDNKYKVSIGLKDPTTTDTDNFWTRLGEAWDASVTAVDKGLDVVVRPVAKKAGGALSGFFSKVGEWLFGKSDTPETESKVNAVAGTGFSSVGEDGKMNLTGISDTDATIYLQQGNFSEGYKKWLTGDQYADLKSTVYLQNGNFSDGYKKWVTGDQYADLKSTVYLQNGNFSDGYKKWVTGDQYADLKSTVYLQNGNFNDGYKKWVTGDQYADLKSTVYLQNGNFNDGYKKWVTGDQYGDLSSSVKLSSGDAGYYNFRNWLTGNQYADVTSTIYLKQGWSGSLSDWIGNSVTVKVNLSAGGGVAYSNGYSASFASGGVISSGFARHLSNIPHYASGTTDAHGTLFLAGEAGPEILGHVGGRTEILNQSQLASTMFAAVRSAMTGVRIGGSIENAVSMDNGEADYEAMYRAMYDAFTDAMTGSNERDKEKVALMRQIAAKEFTAEVTAASVNRAQTRMNRRAGTTIVPVET